MFCPKCGSILVPKKEDKKKILVCSCGYKSTDVSQAVVKETVKNQSKDIEIIEHDDVESLPKMKAECPDCKNQEAYFWLVQTRASDEPQTKFLKCTKCGRTWRDYD